MVEPSATEGQQVEPLTTAECDLRDSELMLMSPQWMRDWLSAKVESLEVCGYAVRLWIAAWHQVPAGSVPDDDPTLAYLVNQGEVERWLEVRDRVLRGWRKCRDGRLYFPPVAAAAMEMWVQRLVMRVREALLLSQGWEVEVSFQADVDRLRRAVDCLRLNSPDSPSLRKKPVLMILAGRYAECGCEFCCEPVHWNEPCPVCDEVQINEDT